MEGAQVIAAGRQRRSKKTNSSIASSSSSSSSSTKASGTTVRRRRGQVVANIPNPVVDAAAVEWPVQAAAPDGSTGAASNSNSKGGSGSSSSSSSGAMQRRVTPGGQPVRWRGASEGGTPGIDSRPSTGSASSGRGGKSRDTSRGRQQQRQSPKVTGVGSNYTAVSSGVSLSGRRSQDFTDIKGKSFEELQQLLLQYGDSAGVSNLVAICSRLKSVPAARKDKAALLAQLWQHLQPHLLACNPRQCAELLLTASKLQHSSSDLYQETLQVLLAGLQGANARVLCNVIYAAGTAAPGLQRLFRQQVEEKVLPAFLASAAKIDVLQTVSNAAYAGALMGMALPLEQLLQGKPSSFYSSAKPQELSNTLYAAAVTCEQRAPPKRELLKLLNGLLQRLPDARPQHISNTLWAAATTGLQLQQRQLQQLVAALLRLPPEPQPLGLALWSAAKLDMRLQQHVVDQLLQQLLQVLPGCQPQTISNTVWGVATMGCSIAPPQAQQLLLALLQPGSANDQAVANTMWGFATMKAELPEVLLESVYAAFAELLPDAGTQATANALWAAATLPEPFAPQQLLTPAAVQQIAAKVPQMKAQELSNIAMACGVLGIRDLQLLLPVFDTAILRLHTGGLSLHGGSDSTGLQLQACCNLCWCGSVLNLRQVARHCCQLAGQCASSSIWPALVTEDKVQLYQLHLWLEDTSCGSGGAGLQGLLSAQQLAECKAAWQHLMQRSSRSGASTSLLQRSVFAAVQKVPSLLNATLETCTADGLFSVDIMASTAGDNGCLSLLAIEVDGPWHFRRPDQGLTGTTSYRNRALAARGYAVVTIPYFDWYKLVEQGEEAQRQYLCDKVQQALAQQQQQQQQEALVGPAM